MEKDVKRLSVDIRKSIREKLGEAVLVAMQNDPDNLLKRKEIVERALRKWLDKYKDGSDGGEGLEYERSDGKLQVEIDEDLFNEARLEAARRKTKAENPPTTMRALVECALVGWLREKGYWPEQSGEEPLREEPLGEEPEN